MATVSVSESFSSPAGFRPSRSVNKDRGRITTIHAPPLSLSMVNERFYSDAISVWCSLLCSSFYYHYYSDPTSSDADAIRPTRLSSDNSISASILHKLHKEVEEVEDEERGVNNEEQRYEYESRVRRRREFFDINTEDTVSQALQQWIQYVETSSSSSASHSHLLLDNSSSSRDTYRGVLTGVSSSSQSMYCTVLYTYLVLYYSFIDIS